MTHLLAGDIGGTKTILTLLAPSPEPGVPAGLPWVYEQSYRSQAYPDLVPMVQAFLQEATQVLRQPITVEKACFGIAGPVVKNTSQLTNLNWELTGDRLAHDLQVQQVALINDFAAVGYGVLGLAAGDLCTLQPGIVEAEAPIAVIGAGTGLGEAMLVPLGENRYQVYPTEGGHADFAPRSPLEFKLLDYLRHKLSIEHVSVERVVSGQGVVAIYQFLRDEERIQPDPAVERVVRDWEQTASPDPALDPGATIAQGAYDRHDPLCLKTLEFFVSTYGAEAGNLALKTLPFGGVYIAGGIAPKNLALIQQGSFLKAFLEKGRLKPVLERIPVHVVLNPQVGLIGAALYAAQQSVN